MIYFATVWDPPIFGEEMLIETIHINAVIILYFCLLTGYYTSKLLLTTKSVYDDVNYEKLSHRYPFLNYFDQIHSKQLIYTYQ